ncbi:hypothetical protein MYX78_02250 [Acidobacteria bacterium AH-259-G07]|nr:hypothetical protein [Acidobacteria bacterium AH-259-G07]
MSDWNWETKSHGEMTSGRRRIKKLPEEWVWQPVKMGPAYGRGGQVGKLLHESVYDCAFCKGTGERPKGSTCPVCKRKSTVRMEPPVVMCAYCKGRGEDKPRSVLTCSACKGKGVISVKEPVEMCTHCNGRGREPTNKIVCGSCRGSGVMTSSGKVEEAGEGFESAGYAELGESDEYPGWVQPPPGSEREALEVILEKGRAGRVTVGKFIGVSSTYAEMVCNALAKKGLVRKGEDRIYYPTPKGKKAVGWSEKEHDHG